MHIRQLLSRENSIGRTRETEYLPLLLREQVCLRQPWRLTNMSKSDLISEEDEAHRMQWVQIGGH